MSRLLKLAIPIKPHLRVYLEEFHEVPYVMNLRDHLGLYIYQMLRRRKFRDRKYFSIDSCTDSLQVLVSEKYGFNHGCMLLHDYQVHLINNYLEDQMMEHAITWVRSAELAGLNNKAAIHRWIELYQLDEGSSDWYHRIKQHYFRWRKKKILCTNIGAPAVP